MMAMRKFAIRLVLMTLVFSFGGGATIEELLGDYPLIDGHNDLAWRIFTNAQYQLETFDLNQSLEGVWEDSHTDIPRLETGLVGAQFWAAYASCDTQHKDAVRAALDAVDVIKRMIVKYNDTFHFCENENDINRAFNIHGKIGSLIGLECGHCIDSSLATLRMFFELGVRYMTLTHNCDTPWADYHANTDGEGLSQFGLNVTHEMNRLGMMIDLSHVSHNTMRDVLAHSQAPIIFSHSSVYSICNHTRNVPDDILQLVQLHNGLVMINYYPDYITCSETATLSDVADHFDYIKNLIGVDHVGIGADYDGISRTPSGLEDVSKHPELLRELQNRGWSDIEIVKVAGQNLKRVFNDVEQIAFLMQVTLGLTPNESLIPVEDLGNNTECRAIVP